MPGSNSQKRRGDLDFSAIKWKKHSFNCLYSSTRIIPFFHSSCRLIICSRCLVFFFVNAPPPPTWAALAGPGNHNSEVYRDTINRVGASRVRKYFRINSALRGEDGFNCHVDLSCPSCVCETRVTV